MNSLSQECYHERVKQFNQGQHTMAMSKKTTMEVELHQDTVEMLEYAKETYGFRSTSKALRVILDYMVADADWEEVFMNQRCLRCGSGQGWQRPES